MTDINPNVNDREGLLIDANKDWMNRVPDRFQNNFLINNILNDAYQRQDVRNGDRAQSKKPIFVDIIILQRFE